MFRPFFMKYRFPLAYIFTKVLANHVHAAVVPRRPRVLTSTPAFREAMGYHDPAPRRIEQPRFTRNTPPISRARSAYVTRTDYSRPAAVKSNGGLRGSTATKWR